MRGGYIAVQNKIHILLENLHVSTIIYTPSVRKHIMYKGYTVKLYYKRKGPAH